MPNPNRHTQLLFPFIYCLPDDIKEQIQPKYYNGKLRRICHTKENGKVIIDYNPEWLESNNGECTFYGLLFRENKVYCQNIEILCKDKNYEPQYLEITETFDRLLNYYTIYHLCILISAILRKKYYKEATLAKNLRTKIIYDTPQCLPKFRYSIQKHHSRERKFYCDTASEGIKRWDILINQALHEISNLSTFQTIGKERYKPGLWTDYRSEPRLVSDSNKNTSSDGVRREKPRKLRRGFFASHIERR